MKTLSTNKGFIALISMLLLSAVLSVLIFSTSTSTFFARFDTADHENKRIASSLAESCAHLALLYIAQDYSYDPNDAQEAVKDGTCYIVSVLPHGPRSGTQSTITIQTKGIYQSSISDFEVKATVVNPRASISPTDSYIKILSWKENF